MDLLLRKKYSYRISNSFDNEREKLEKILKGKWYDFSKTICGEMNSDDTFTFYFNLLPFSRFNPLRIVYLRGQILNSGNDTTINITLSPNGGLLSIFYFLPLISLNIFFGDNNLLGDDNTRLNNFVILLFFELTLFIIIQIIRFVLRRKFEKALRVGHFDIGKRTKEIFTKSGPKYSQDNL
jgi:hypothetical protein